MDTPAPRGLAVCGWTPEASEALAALEATGAFRAIGVADGSGAALVRARQETNVPCVRQARPWLASETYEAVLLASPDSLPLATLAASRKADILLLPGACDAETLEGATHAARAHGVRLVILRPDRHDAGLTELARLLEEPEWHPRYLDITVEGAAETDRLVGTIVAHTVRLLPERHGLVHASSWAAGPGLSEHAVRAVLGTTGSEVHLNARHAPVSYLRIVGDTLGGTFELCLTERRATFSYMTASGERVCYTPGWVDHWRVEAYRAIEADDAGQALEEAALLSAVARSAATGEPQATDCCRHPDLRVIEGRGHREPSRANLRLVVVS